MPPHILYIRGSAVPYNEPAIIQQEIHEQRREIESFGSSGARVTRVGDPVRGFSLRQVQEAFEEMPDIPIVFVSAHGNVYKQGHYIRLKEPTAMSNGLMATDTLYQKMAEFSGDSALNIFMVSCGSGRNVDNATGHLPEGSTTVNFTSSEVVCSFSLDAHGLQAPVKLGSNQAEDLFLNILCNGLVKGEIYLPQITVSKGSDKKSRTWDLWELARKECFVRRPEVQGNDLLQAMEDALGRFTSKEQIKKALLFMNEHIGAAAKSEIPVAGSLLEMKPQGLFKEVIEHNLLGIICAIAYIQQKSDIRAFQIQPPNRPDKNSLQGREGLLASHALPSTLNALHP